MLTVRHARSHAPMAASGQPDLPRMLTASPNARRSPHAVAHMLSMKVQPMAGLRARRPALLGARLGTLVVRNLRRRLPRRNQRPRANPPAASPRPTRVQMRSQGVVTRRNPSPNRPRRHPRPRRPREPPVVGPRPVVIALPLTPAQAVLPQSANLPHRAVLPERSKRNFSPMLVVWVMQPTANT